MTTAVIIQARMNSKRFPGKVMARLGDRSVLEHVIERSMNIGPQVMLAVPEGELELFMWVGPAGIWRFGGSENDVLSRYLDIAIAQDIDIIMRITADCPLLRPDLCRKVLNLYNECSCDYAAIGWPRGGFPKGYGCEVFSKSALRTAAIEAFAPEDREHVTTWIERNLRCIYLHNDKDESHLNYCVDYPEDIPRLVALLDKPNKSE